MIEVEIATVGENIARLRRNKKLTQVQVAQRCGIHHTEISRIERGMRDMRFSAFMRIASALKVKPARLLVSTRSDSARRR